MLILILAGAAALALLTAFLLGGNRRAKARKNSLEEIGTVSGVAFEPFGPDLKFLESTGLPYFAEGRSSVAKNFFRFKEEDGFESFFFDYACAVGAPGSETKSECTAALFSFNKNVFPAFFLSADGAAPQPGIPGYGPADIKNFPGLQENAKVYSDDVNQLAALLNSGKSELFSKEPDWSAQAAGQYLLLYKAQQLASPGSYLEFVKAAKLLALRLAV